MTDETAPAEQLAKELEAAFRNRADLYRLLLEELTETMGREAAERQLIKVIERRGQEVGHAAFPAFGPNDAPALGEAFLRISPNGGRMYPTDVTRQEEGITFKVTRCPLKDAWVDAGVSDSDLAALCRIAGAFDRGLFETAGVRFSNITWTPGQTGCCTISLTNADSRSPEDERRL